jgi:hypothetical protein
MTDDDYEKYNHAEAIRQQIRKVNNLIAEMDTEDQQSFEQYFSKCFMGLASLEAMISPFREEDYESNLEEQNPLSMSRGDQLQFIYETQKEMMDFLHQENLFYAQRTGRRKT